MINEDGFKAACREIDRQIHDYADGDPHGRISVLVLSEILLAYEYGKRVISLGGDIVDAPGIH